MMDGWAVGCDAKTLRNLAQASGAHPSQGWGPPASLSGLPAFLIGSLSLMPSPFGRVWTLSHHHLIQRTP